MRKAKFGQEECIVLWLFADFKGGGCEQDLKSDSPGV